MAKKKKQPQDLRSKQPEFRSTPFSALKHAAVAPPTARTPETAPPPPPPAPVKTDESELFLQAMGGVKPLGTRKQAVHPSPLKRPSAPVPAPKQCGRTEADRAEAEAFTQAIGRLKLDVTFVDILPGEDELKPLAVNRLRQLKRGVINVDRQLDLHGLTRDEALAALPRFLHSARSQGEKAVLIITGKGNNSPAEPVLQQAVTGWLREKGKEMVVEFAPAPREMGGSGAFVVFLRAMVPPE